MDNSVKSEKSGTLRVAAILVLLSGILDLLIGLVLTAIEAVVLASGVQTMSMAYPMLLLGILSLIEGIFYIAVGVSGIRTAGGKRDAKPCMNKGIALIIVAVIMMMVNIYTTSLSGVMDVQSFIGIGGALFNLIVPFIYYAGAKKIYVSQHKEL